MVNPAAPSMTLPNGAAATSAAQSFSSSSASSRRSFYICCGKKFSIDSATIFDSILHCLTIAVEKFVLVLGPLLICFASAIIGGLSWTFFTIVLPMIRHKHELEWYGPLIVVGHVLFVFFLLIQICFNYFYCVTTSNKGPFYDQVVRELAIATEFDYPETPNQVERFRRDYEDKMLLRMKRRQMRASEDRESAKQQHQQPSVSVSVSSPSSSMTMTTLDVPAAGAGAGAGSTTTTTTTTTLGTTTLDTTTATTTATTSGVTQRKGKAAAKKSFPRPNKLPTPIQVRSWMLMASDEWGYCQRSKQAKPPRSHYDHVTKTLVMCLDHYCPWMFNAIGYFNYRYFCNFLWFVETGMIYGAILTYEPFIQTTGTLYKHQLQEYRKSGVWKHLYPMVPIAKERLPISLVFMLCLAIGMAVLCLGGFHFYLVLTGQTTIEFHGNWVNRRKAKKLNKKYQNPYDLGYQRNWQQVYGSQRRPLLAFLIPSTRQPEFLPLPISGPEGRRPSQQISSTTTFRKEANKTDAPSAPPVAHIV